MFFRYLLIAMFCMACFQAKSETLTCTEISKLPFTISASGTYCLVNNLSTSQTGGGGILINAGNVTLDCNGRTISNTNPNNSDVGIASGKRTRVTVENCDINGFEEGIHFDTMSNMIKIRNNTIRNSKTYGILIWGNNVEIVGNSVIDTKYVSAFRNYNQAIVAAAYSPGILSRDVVIRGNRIIGLSGTAQMQAIRVEMSVAPIIENNHVGRMLPNSDGYAFGILTTSTSRAVIRNNVLTGSPSYSLSGIQTDSTAICADNIINGFRTTGTATCGVSSNNLSN